MDPASSLPQERASPTLPAGNAAATEFPGLGATTYLNSAAHGLLSARGRRAIEAHLARWSSDPSWDGWNESVDEARRAFAHFIGAREDEVAVQPNASAGVSAVMHALSPASGRRRIVTTDVDFPAAPTLAGRQVARGFVHDHLKGAPAQLRLDAWRAHMGPDVALACAPAVASFTGHRLNVRALGEAAHATGAPILVDAFQALGTFPLDVRRLDCDFLVSGVYKWLLAPSGVAFLYVRRDHHRLLSTTSSWQGLSVPYGFDPLSSPAEGARRFEGGGPSVISCAAVPAGLGLLTEVGLAAIEKKNAALVERVLAGAATRGYEILTSRDPAERASILTFRVPKLDAALAALKAAKVAVTARAGGIRVSPHFYNVAADVDRLFEVLDKAN